MRDAWRFLVKVLSDFRRNQGVLLSGAVAYYTLLSIIPLFVVLLVILSQFVDEQRILNTITDYLSFIISGNSAAITQQVKNFLAHRQVVGVVGALVLLFFSSMAFSVLESALAVIFRERIHVSKRHFLVSAILPYLFIALIALGLLLVTGLSGALQMMGQDTVRLMGRSFGLAGLSGVLLYLLGVGSVAFMLTALYLVMPVGHVSIRHALVGGVTATVLWEIVRNLLIWYFARLSMVNLLYGSLATAIVVLLTLEALSIILLIGAQVIAELEHKRPRINEPAPLSLPLTD